ncbi:MAG: alpha/beta hydrolase [Chloroherpetonaceae bacterium]|nr:alpha/beta hydrolase [Chloroherpetonaceae bacterium]MDW8437218.1 alpha/beta fold hydrolase [Chloroherpetonaceae bacterium]
MLACLARNLDAKERHVTLLHAFPLSAEMWLPQLDALQSNGYAVLAPHAFGFGGSPAKANWTFNDYADALNALLESLGVSQTTLVGISMGGYKAFAFWRKHPAKVKSLVLCATRAEADSPEAKKTRYEFIDAVLKNGVEEAVARMLPRLLGKTSLDSRPDVVRRVEAIIRQSSPEAIAETLKALAERDDSTPTLPSVNVPTLVLAGAEDALMNEAVLKVIHDGVKHSEMKTIEAAGHLPNLEQPDIFNALLLEHLQSLNRR